MDILKFKSLESTNQYLKQNYQKLKHQQIIWTETQNKGIGRNDNTWYANKNSLTFSFILKENLHPKLINLLPIFTATIVHKVIKQYNNQCLIKWPNDLFIHNKKIAGILIEGIHQEKLQAMIIGIGINLNNQTFPNDIKDKTTSLKIETNETYHPLKILNEIVTLFKQDFADLYHNSKKVINYYNDHHLLNQKIISYYDQNVRKFGKCLEIDKNGLLVIKNNDDVIHLISGEVKEISTK